MTTPTGRLDEPAAASAGQGVATQQRTRLSDRRTKLLLLAAVAVLVPASWLAGSSDDYEYTPDGVMTPTSSQVAES